MRAGNLYHKIAFYAKVITRDAYGASADSWPLVTINTRGEIREIGGVRTLNNEEKFYSKSKELTVRYNSNIVETMKIQIDGSNDLWFITYMEILGRNEGIKLTIEKCADGLSTVLIDPPTLFSATFDSETDINLAWTNNIDGDAISIERSIDGNNWSEIHRTVAGITTYTDTYLSELTRYFYRIRHFNYYNYSAYSTIDDATTDVYILPSVPTGLVTESITDTSIKIDWDNMGADAYQIWESETENGTYIQLNTNLVTNTYTHTIIAESIHWYKVRSVRNVPLLYSSFCAPVESVSWSAYWLTLISAIIANTDRDAIVLTFPSAQTSLTDTDFTVTVNGVARAVSSASWTGAAITLVLASDVAPGDVVVVTFVKTGDTSNVTNNVEIWYGIQIDESNSSPDITRIASTVGEMTLHASLPVHANLKACLLADAGTVNYYLDPTDWTKQVGGAASALDGSAGQVMIEWGAFYYKVDNPSAGIQQVKISLYPCTGFTLVPKHYISAYEANITRSTSKLGSFKNTGTDYRGGNNNAAWDAAANTLLGMPVTNINRTNGRTYARNRGTGWNQYGYNDHKWLFWFFAIEYATLNSQKAVNATLTAEGYKQGGLGGGVSTAVASAWDTFNGYNPFVPCGASDSLASGSGEYTYTKEDFGGAGVDVNFTVNRYRGHEMPFGHIWKICDGINIDIKTVGDGDASSLYSADDPSIWTDANYTGYTNRGNIARANNWLNKALMGAGAEILPRTDGCAATGNTVYYCDYFYTSVTGSSMRMLFVGGGAHYGTRDGLACSRTDSEPAAAGAYFGFRTRFQGA